MYALQTNIFTEIIVVKTAEKELSLYGKRTADTDIIIHNLDLSVD